MQKLLTLTEVAALRLRHSWGVEAEFNRLIDLMGQVPVNHPPKHEPPLRASLEKNHDNPANPSIKIDTFFAASRVSRRMRQPKPIAGGPQKGYSNPY